MSVILLSFAMYGAWCFFHDSWKWWLEPRLMPMPNCSFLVVVKNLDGEIEDLLRFLVRKIENSENDDDIVVVDVSSNDFTAGILERLASDIEIITVVVRPAGQRVISEAIALCRGKVVHVLDLSNRMNAEDFMVTVCALLRQDGHDVLVRRVSK
jgi:ribosomal silencing factor RsfS